MIHFSEQKNNFESGGEKEKELKLFDAVIVLGHGLDFDKKDNGAKLSFDGKMRAIAAGGLYQEGLVSRIIISGGKTAGDKFPSEAEVTAEYLEKHFNIPPSVIIKEEESIDTVTNALEIKHLLGEKWSGKLAVLSNEYHTKRVQKIFQEQGLNAELITAEDMLLQRSGHYKPLVEKYLHSGETKKKKIIEAMLRSLLIIDPQGKIQRAVTRHTRG